MNRLIQKTILTVVRERLGTWPEEISAAEWKNAAVSRQLSQVENQLDVLLGKIRAIGELFVGMANGPFLLVLKASSPERFKQFAEQQPTHDIRITFDDVDGGVQGRIRPLHAPQAYTLSFGLPRVLQDHILFDENRGIRLAPDIKRRFFSEITVYRREGQRDVLYRLTYDPEAVRQLRDGRR